jgi:hypothetical protein
MLITVCIIETYQFDEVPNKSCHTKGFKARMLNHIVIS